MPAVVVRAMKYGAAGIKLQVVAVLAPHPSALLGVYAAGVADMDVAETDFAGDGWPDLAPIAGELVAGLEGHGVTGLRVVYPVLS